MKKEYRGKQKEYKHGDFYVSPDGCDQWSGKLPVPNADGTDGPFATVERARDEVRVFKNGIYRNVYVLIRGGEYKLTKEVKFHGEDSHYDSYKVVYAAYPGETPVFHSDVEVLQERDISCTFPDAKGGVVGKGKINDQFRIADMDADFVDMVI